MSEKSINTWWVRGLLWLHFVAVAVSIAAIWPNSAIEARAAVPLILLLCLIAVWSSRLANGGVMGFAGWSLHAVWGLALLWSAVQCWGPFCFQPQPTPGDLSSFGRSPELAIGVRLLILLLAYSGIPISLALLGKACGDQWPNFRGRRIGSLTLFAVALLATIVFRFVWKGPGETAGWIAGILWAAGLAMAAYLSASGDRLSVRILLCGAGVLGLVKLV